ncbi:hypothetical protein PCE1_003518 [Barthelona sp. PCE]
MTRVLVVGLRAGKTTFIQALKSFKLTGQPANLKELPNPLPTNGVQNDRFSDMQFRECGSGMLSQWMKYVEDCDAIVYVVNPSAVSMIPDVYTHLLGIAGNEHVQRNGMKRFIVMLRHSDIDVIETQNLLMLDFSQQGGCRVKPTQPLWTALNIDISSGESLENFFSKIES